MEISNPTLVAESDSVRFSCSVTSSRGDTRLWFLLPRKFQDVIDPTSLDAFFLGLAFYASSQGEELVIRGKISERLYYSYLHLVSYILSRLHPPLKSTTVSVDDLSAGNHHANGEAVAAGFSGGIDSFCTFIDHNVAPPCESYRITHFLFNNVGSHGQHDPDGVFKGRLAKVRKCADELGVEVVPVSSNLNDFFQGTKFQLTHTLRNTAAAATLQGFFGKFLYSSGFRIDECFIGETYAMGYTEPFLVHLLSTNGLECISTGGRYSRLEKTQKVSEYPPTYRHLDVCLRHRTDQLNCGRCFKCARTLLTFEAFGVIENYRHVFDLAAFYRTRDELIAVTLREMSRKSPIDAEVLDLITERGLPRPSVFTATKLRMKRKFWDMQRRGDSTHPRSHGIGTVDRI